MGYTKVTSRVDEAMAKIGETGYDRLYQSLNVARNETLKTLSGNRSGRTYKVPGTDRTYTASSPGEAPAQRLSGLRQSVHAAIEKRFGLFMFGKVGTKLGYGRHLELGTSKIKPRPWLRPSLERAEPEIRKILYRKWL